MTKKITDKGNRYAYVQLAGKTLEEIDKERKKSGCKDPNSPGKRYYGLTEATIEVQPGEVGCLNAMFLSRKAVATAKFFDVEVKYHGLTTICLPRDKSKLSGKAKAEWDRFEKEVVKHEALHYDDARVLAEDIAKEVMSLSATGKGDTIEDAGKDALWQLEKAYRKAFGGTELEKRINKAMKDRDAIDGHGSGSGAKLKTSVA